MKTIRNKLFLLAALAVIGFMTPMPAAAGGHDLVSDDGDAISTAEMTAMAGELVVKAGPYRGTGVLSAEDRLEATAGSVPSAQDIKNLPFAGGKVGTESVIGSDTRIRTYTTTYPERATALVTFDGGYCTGWFYGPNVVATAGHCVHTGGSLGKWRTNVRVYPGYNAGSAPYGSFAAKRLYSVTGWTTSGSELYDYGMIKLYSNAGNTVGWYGYFYLSSYAGLPTITVGYPGDASPAKSQWIAADKVYYQTTYQMFYRNDTYGGMSGSGVWYDRPAGSTGCANGPCAFGIHAYGLHGAYPHSTYNHGIRFNATVVSNLTYVRNLL